MRCGTELHALVVVVDGDGEDPLGLLLSDDVIVQEGKDLARLGKLSEFEVGTLRELLLNDLIAKIDALVADVDTRTSDQFLDLLLGLTAEGTLQQLAAISELRHD
jgi:hypothetical protein